MARSLTRTIAPVNSSVLTTHLAWFVLGSTIAFAVPYVLTSLTSVHHDFYLLIYFAVVGGLLTAYATTTGASLADAVARHWRWSVLLAVPVTAFVIFGVFRQEDSTAHPGGAYFVFEIVWRGAAYGLFDALLLSAFPALVAYEILSRDIGSVTRKLGYGALVLIGSIVITATYHLGYEQYREDGIGAPETGNTIISVPAIVTSNPLGSLVAHTSMHVTAVMHAYETDIFLPPQTDADE
jgi:hypothetical protein